jgi:hypothetical protein
MCFSPYIQLQKFIIILMILSYICGIWIKYTW